MATTKLPYVGRMGPELGNRQTWSANSSGLASYPDRGPWPPRDQLDHHTDVYSVQAKSAYARIPTLSIKPTLISAMHNADQVVDAIDRTKLELCFDVSFVGTPPSWEVRIWFTSSSSKQLHLPDRTVHCYSERHKVYPDSTICKYLEQGLLKYKQDFPGATSNLYF